MTVDKGTHQLIGDPQVSFNGVAGLTASNGFASEARAAVAEAIAEMKKEQIADRAVFRENLRIHLKRFVHSGIGTKPVIMTTVVEV